MPIKNIKKASLFALAALFVGLAIHPRKVLSSAQELYNKWMVLTMILDKVERFYVDERNPDDLLKNAIDGMLSGLDPHTVYISSEQYKVFCENYEGYLGIGLKYSIISGQYVVTSLVENGPAAISGIKLGDRIVKIEGVAVQDLDAPAMEQHLSGNEQKCVALEIARPKVKELLTFELPKRQINRKSVPAALMLDEQTGYIKITNFTDSTPQEMDAAFHQLQNEGMARLVLDLRNNSGGAFEAGAAVADRFLSGGKMIVFTKGRAMRSSQQYIATNGNTLPRIPLIVMVNEATASDAEIVAGAIQDWDRGLIVGRRTFGKALVQTEFPFQDGSILLLTTARYYTPLGRLIQSDYYVNPGQTLKDEEYRFKKYKTPRGRLVFGGGGIRPDVLLKDDNAEISPVLKKLYLTNEDVFFKFADLYAANLPPDHQAQELGDFLKEFKVSAEMLEDFYRQAGAADPTLKADALRRQRRELAKALKIEIAWRLWGEKGRYAAAALYDSEISKALLHFDKAAELISKQ